VFHHPGASSIVRITFRQYWNLLSRYLKPESKRVLLLVVLLLASIGLQLAGPQILREFIDRAIDGQPVRTLIGFALLFLGMALVIQVINLAETWVAENVGWIATNNLRGDLALHVLQLDRAFHNQHTPGSLIERVDGDVAKLGNFFSRFTVHVLGNGLLGIGVLALMFGIDWRVGGAMTLFTIIAILAMNALRDIGVPFWAAERESSARLFGFIEERLAGTEDIRAAGATGYVMRSNHERARDFRVKRQKAAIVGSISYSLPMPIFAVGTAVALGFGAWLYRDDRITLGTIFLIYQYTTLLTQPIEQITRQMQDLQQAGASVGRVQDLLDTRRKIEDGPGVPPTTGSGAPSVEFRNVTFAYDDDEPVLREISFRLEPGAVLGLVGRTGSGKTTITRLLARLNDPTSGEVLIDDVDLRQYRLNDLRQRISLVTQDIQLFRATVRDNLTLFDPAVRDDQILEILADLGLQRWLDSMPDGLDSMISSSGTSLSAGEAQLLAFARVFLRDPQIVILDEASSRLDPVTERRLEHAIDRLLTGRTGIVIAHRLATVQRADSIMVMQGGRILEYGVRRELLENPDSHFVSMLRTGQDLFSSDDEVDPLATPEAEVAR
jgi:ABC-type multidrug transport system fused ATPase/permease subunit